jgi:hypothetical protein
MVHDSLQSAARVFVSVVILCRKRAIYPLRAPRKLDEVASQRSIYTSFVRVGRCLERLAIFDRFRTIVLGGEHAESFLKSLRLRGSFTSRSKVTKDMVIARSNSEPDRRRSRLKRDGRPDRSISSSHVIICRYGSRLNGIRSSSVTTRWSPAGNSRSTPFSKNG